MASKRQTKVIKTNKNGIADLLCLKAGETPLFIEIKEDSDTVKPLQYYRRKELIRLGFESIIIDK